MSKLWEKANTKVEDIIVSFTVGQDYILDKELLKYDCLGSLAHIKMLRKIGLLKGKDFVALKNGLKEIYRQSLNNSFEINLEDEDCHTAIENFLIKKYKDIGKKVHTGRSRNDQILTALRLFEKDNILKINILILEIALKFINFAQRHEFIPLPGYTHYQRAMLSSIGMLFSSYAESLIDDSKLLISTLNIIDKSPLGSAAGYGVSLPLDRAFSAKIMGFKEVHNNVIYVQNSRGKFELSIIHSLINTLSTLNKFSTDMILFTTKEFAFFTLPDNLTTGSSIMPQKKNPDVLELIRAKSNAIIGYYNEISSVLRNLPSGYHRDYQIIKEPLIKAFKTTRESLEITLFIADKFQVNIENCKNAITKDIFAADIALEDTQKGIPFRDAYKSALEKISNININFVDNLKSKNHLGAPGNLGLNKIKQNLKMALSDAKKISNAFNKTIENLLS
jgi:argininosuccinate lyase